MIYTASGTHDRDTMDGRMVGAATEPDAVALAANANALSAGKRYSTSKLCTVMYAYELHRRLRTAGSTVSSIAYDPGSVPGTGFLRGMPRPVQVFSTTRAMNWLSRCLGVTVSDVAFSGGSLATLATGPEYADASGKYFQAEQGTLTAVRSAKLSYDERRAAKLWDDSRRLVHLTWDGEPAHLR